MYRLGFLAKEDISLLFWDRVQDVCCTEAAAANILASPGRNLKPYKFVVSRCNSHAVSVPTKLHSLFDIFPRQTVTKVFNNGNESTKG